MRHNAYPVVLTSAGARALIRRLVGRARFAAVRKDWRENHRLCREHDDLALAYPHGLRAQEGSQ